MIARVGRRVALAAGVSLIMVAPAIAQEDMTGQGVATPANWPAARSVGLIDAGTEAFVEALMARMTIEQKVGQMIQADIGSIRPEDLRSYPLGSILAGGSSAPLDAPDRSPAAAWLATARAFGSVAMEERAGNARIPLLFGVDAVHGNSNVVGATLFPHNIALGAAHDPDLIRRIGEATARETAAAGIDWAFAPTLAVPQDDRWGRTYEGYAEDPALVARYAGAMIKGLQGKPGTGRIQDGRVAASAKHFLGDGGTENGIDQGNDVIPEAELIATHAQGYPPAIRAGTMTVMASYNSWMGRKMHGNRSLLTDVLKGRMGFDGFIVGDWNGHAQLPGCDNGNCPASFNAGLDMVMAADGWRAMYTNTLAQAKSGVIPASRIDDAVRRILRVKARLGLFDPARPFAGRAGVIGAPAHRSLAREAVAKSLVLLKNDGVLPIKAGANILVAGPHADDIGLQSGGWTLSWQGEGNANKDFPGAQSIHAGIAEAMAKAGGTATLSIDGRYTRKPDLAVVVFGEQPYAEGRGDIRSLEFEPGDKAALALLKRFRAAGIRTVSVFLSGRPMWVNPEINQSDAFVAAWLPGSEGGGIADVLIGDANGRARRDFTGTLSFSWPRTAAQFALNMGEPGYDPLFAYGHGLSYARGGVVPQLSEDAGIATNLANTGLFFVRGVAPAPFRVEAARVAQAPVDSATQQEAAVRLTFADNGRFAIAGPAIDLSREREGYASLQLSYRIDRAGTGPIAVSVAGVGGKGAVDGRKLFTATPGQWQTVRIPLRCLGDRGLDAKRLTTPLSIAAGGGLVLSIADVRISGDSSGAVCP